MPAAANVPFQGGDGPYLKGIDLPTRGIPGTIPWMTIDAIDTFWSRRLECKWILLDQPGNTGELLMPLTHRHRDNSANPEVLTTGQAAAAIGVRSVNTVKKWVENGTLDGFRRGSRVLVLKDSVVRLQNQGRSPRGGAARSLAPSRVGNGVDSDVLSELRRLPLNADRAERAVALARTVAEIRHRVGSSLRRNGISRAFLFGSAARGDVHARSDIDIAVELPQNSTIDLIDFVGLGLELETVLGRKVDLINLAAMKPRVREVAIREQVPLLSPRDDKIRKDEQDGSHV